MVAAIVKGGPRTMKGIVKRLEPAVDVPLDEPGDSRFSGVIVLATKFKPVEPDPEWTLPGRSTEWEHRKVLLVGTRSSRKNSSKIATYRAYELRGPKRERLFTAATLVKADDIKGWLGKLTHSSSKNKRTH